MGVGWGFCQDLLYNPFCEFAGSLVLFQDDENPKAGFNIVPFYCIHGAVTIVLVILLIPQPKELFDSLVNDTDNHKGNRPQKHPANIICCCVQLFFLHSIFR
jgi:hypothetical protein